MEKIYYDTSHPAGYGGKNALVRASGKGRKEVNQFLNSQQLYRIHKRPKRKFKRARIQTNSMGVWFQVIRFVG